ncbi:metallophosphoesterase [Pedobacter miscanthi]|jgi:hypothetical protein|uniref:metallophosphoesterase n=1 Tax=Pedobacter miscanthi TaxID=2259170 RepID=UPI00292EB48E|nr:metallophosphoesterase [Pedobacter miscanthi]
MKRYKNVILALFLILSIPSFAQVEQDGPYIWRSGKQIINRYILNDVLHTDSLKEDASVTVRFASHTDWNFDFKLHKKIVVPPVSYDGVDKMLVLSDIEGEFEAFRALMIGNGVMDQKYNWIFGKGQLVICGDLFDRGKEVMPYLWLLYKLEEDAAKKGGFVHVVLGNHDIMNMAGDLRYHSPKYASSALLMGLEYAKLIDADTEIGKWLRSKNAIEKIGDRIFMHAGISPKINATDFSLQTINDKCRSYYGIATKSLPAEGHLLMGSSGPFWYRGYFGKDRTNPATVDSTLAKFACKQIVVGHTITKDNIAGYYNGKVVGVDVNEHRGDRKALLFIGNKTFVVDDKGIQKQLEIKDTPAEIN